MIKNDRQLDITRKQAVHFEQAIAQAKGKTVPDDVDPVIWKASIEGMESQLATMEREIAEYRFLNGSMTMKDAKNWTEVRAELPSDIQEELDTRIERRQSHDDPSFSPTLDPYAARQAKPVGSAGRNMIADGDYSPP